MYDERTVQVLYPLLNNLYYICLDIIDVCAKWVPRRQRDDERIWLATQLQRETVEVPMYLGFLKGIDRKPDPSIRITNSTLRYQHLKESEDELDVVVGMNILAQGVFGSFEHRQFYRFDPVFFAPAFDTITFELMSTERAKEFIRRRDPERVKAIFARWHHHLVVESLPQLAPYISAVADVGIFDPDLPEQGERLFEQLAADVGVDVRSLTLELPPVGAAH
jgi:hypothetical protein